jgi:2-polyprenyl-3-methyl-5-hydroxy-6-metoxy-1,4-benzoquinol methylase
MSIEITWANRWNNGLMELTSGASNVETQGTVESWLKQIWPETLLDIGAGAGRYGLTAQDMYTYGKVREKIHTTAVEVWAPYIDKYKLHTKYDEVINKDVRDIDNFKYDVVIFGDILEHLTKEDALAVWDKVSKQARFAIICIPIIHHPQGAGADGNEHERHLEEDWSVDSVLESFKGIVSHEAFEITGAFLAEF